jgi:beta-lactamase superfamily II metal-dependent hydrolase
MSKSRTVSKEVMITFARISLLFLTAALLGAASPNLDIYWIDTEGGGGTLIVAPSGESLLIDTGWRKDDRDAKRIYQVAAQQAGLKKIDYVIITHYHADHVGGVGALSKMIPLGRFFDHGDNVEARPGTPAAEEWAIYQEVAKDKRSQPKPGEKIPLKGVDITVVTANGELIQRPINGGGPSDAALCKDPVLKRPDQGENGRSVGALLQFGKFKFLDTGDVTWNKEVDLACPVNRLGHIDLYQTNHHGMDMSGAPQYVWSLGFTAAVMNNGPMKGGVGSYLEVVKKAPGLVDLWQLHKSLVTDDAHNASEQFIANLEPEDQCQGHWLKATIEPKGRYTMTNSRNHFSKSYKAR